MPIAIRWSVGFGCAATAASLGGCASSANQDQAEPAANATYEQAEAAVSNGDYEKAVEILSVLAKTELSGLKLPSYVGKTVVAFPRGNKLLVQRAEQPSLPGVSRLDEKRRREAAATTTGGE